MIHIDLRHSWMDKFKLAKLRCCMVLKASSVAILINLTTKIEVITELRSIHNRKGLRKPILQPSNDIVNGCEKWTKWSSTKVEVLCHSETYGKRAIHWLTIVKESKLLKPGWWA